MRIVNLSPSRDKPIFPRGSVEKSKMMWVPTTAKIIPLLCLQEEQQHKGNSALGAASGTTPIPRDEKWAQPGAAPPPQESPFSLQRHRFTRVQPRATRAFLMWRGRRGIESYSDSCGYPVTSVRRLSRSPENTWREVSTAEVHVTELSNLFWSLFFQSKEAANLERMTRHASV